MTHRLTTNYAKNYRNRTLIVKVIVENVVTCFLGTQCRSTFIRLAVVASQNREITLNSDKNLTLQQFKVIDLGVNQKLTCDFLLVTKTNRNFGRICYCFRDIDA